MPTKTMINLKTCYATVGNMSMSGTLITLRFFSAKADAKAIFTYFTDGAYTGTVGYNGSGFTTYNVSGWFQKDRSGFQMREAYAEITLVFDQQNVQGLVIGSGTASNRYDPVYSLSDATEERPIEQHPGFTCSRAYNLYELVVLGGTASALPAWAATDTNPAAIHDGYLWSRTQPSSPDAEHEYIPVQPATDFGVDTYLIPRPVVTSTIYYKSRSILSSDLVAVGALKAPGETYGLPSTQSCWLVTSCNVQEASDTLLAVTTTYQYAAEGYRTWIYPLA